MKILLVGSAGREHALAILMKRSTLEPRIYVAMDYRNPGLERVSEETKGRWFLAKTTDPIEIERVAEEISPDLVVIGPEEPLFSGVATHLRGRGYTVFGADAKCAEIEKNKVFARTLMWKYEIPGRLYFKAFKTLEESKKFIEFAGDVVIKPARQAGGKGVKVLKDTHAYLSKDKANIKKSYLDKLFSQVEGYGDIDYKILIEQRVEGVEYSVQAVTDGSYTLFLPVVQDHPHAFEYDTGPETGGMGSISGPGWVPPFLTVDEYERSKLIVDLVIKSLANEVGTKYVGAIAGQMMLTGLWGPTVIEFYSRFGDPEIGNIVPVVESDFLEIIDKASRQKLASAKLDINSDRVVVVKAVAPAGYPDNKKLASGHPITIDDARIRELGCEPLYASIELRADGLMYTMGSRVVEIVCYGNSYEEAYSRSEKAVSYVQTLDRWPLFHRSDIGSEWLLKERIRVAEKMRRVYRSRATKGLLGEAYVWVPGEGIYSNPLLSPLRW
uniref:phosphoribosylamine--glycine ligase n=1 Tax=Ignisphaera aggregans TaxID=334771 RepID=A0A7C2ZNJ9_9CREN